MGTALKIRVALVDDQPLVRAGFRLLLESEEDIEVVGEADDGEAALQVISATSPDVVLMDIRMPGLDGVEVTRRIVTDERLSSVKVVMLTTFELDEYIFDSLRAGASGFLVKHTQPSELVRAVRVVAGGDALLSPGVTRRLIEEFASRPAAADGEPHAIAALTDRESQIVLLVAEGLSNQQIAERLVISPETVRTHVSRAMAKLQARDRAQLVVFAYRSGLARAPGHD